MNDSFIKNNSSELQPHLCLQHTRSYRKAWQASELMLPAMPHLTHTMQNQHRANKLTSTAKAIAPSLHPKYRLWHVQNTATPTWFCSCKLKTSLHTLPIQTLPWDFQEKVLKQGIKQSRVWEWWYRNENTMSEDSESQDLCLHTSHLQKAQMSKAGLQCFHFPASLAGKTTSFIHDYKWRKVSIDTSHLHTEDFSITLGRIFPFYHILYDRIYRPMTCLKFFWHAILAIGNLLPEIT